MSVSSLRQISADLRAEARRQLRLAKGDKTSHHRQVAEFLVRQADRIYATRSEIATRVGRRGL